MLIKRALHKLGVGNKVEFCRSHEGITVDILRGVVNGDGRRVNVALWTPKILGLLNITAEDWNTP